MTKLNTIGYYVKIVPHMSIETGFSSGRPLADAIDEKIFRHSSDTLSVTGSKSRKIVSLVAPKEILTPLGGTLGGFILPSLDNLQDEVRVQLTSGDGVNPYKSAQLMLVPNDKSSSAVFRIIIEDRGEPKLTYRYGTTTQEPVIPQQDTIDFFMGLIDQAQQKVKTLEEYRHDLYLLTSPHREFSQADFEMMDRALTKSFNSHKDHKRESGEPYFVHVAATVTYLINAGITDANTITAAYLHDVYEDDEKLKYDPNNKDGETHQQWLRKTWESIATEFNPTVADIVLSVTRPVPDGIYPKDPKKADRIYEDGLERGPFEAVLVKLADRLHNVRTLWALKDEEKIKETVLQTRDKYLIKIFRREIPYSRRYLAGEITMLAELERKRLLNEARERLLAELMEALKAYPYFFENPAES